jgi:hypothetical protein
MSTSQAAQNFLSKLGQLKIKEVPQFLRAHVSKDSVREYGNKYFQEYREKYIETGSIMPVFHVMGGVFATAYITVWPTEYRHFKAQQNGGH